MTTPRRQSWGLRLWRGAPAVAGALLGLACWLCTAGPPFRTLEFAALDLGYRWRTTSQPPAGVVIAAIDDEALAAFPEPQTEWGSHFAAAIQRLEGLGASAIGLDFVMPHPLPPDRSVHDRRLAAAVRHSDRVILASLWKADPGGPGQHILPKALLWQGRDDAEFHIGFCNQTPDADGRVRAQRLYLQAEDRTYFSLPLLLAARHLGVTPAVDTDGVVWLGERPLRGEPRDTLRLSSASPPGQADTIGFTGLVDGSTPDAVLAPKVKNRVVILGGTYRESQDRHVTPMGEKDGLPGVFLVAAEVQALITGEAPRSLPRGFLAGAFAVLGAAHGMLVWWTRRLRTVAPLSIGAAVLLGSFSCLGLAGFDLVVPGIALAAVIPATYLCRVIRFPHGFDAFISYRRSTDADKARLIDGQLWTRQIRSFLDVRQLGPGFYEDRLRTAIADAPNFILLISPSSLDRLHDPDDWVRREIELALAAGKRIIPVFEKECRLPPPVPLPPSVAALADFNGVEYSHVLNEATIQGLVKFLAVGWRRRMLTAS